MADGVTKLACNLRNVKAERLCIAYVNADIEADASIRRIRRRCIPAGGEDAARAFYCGILGLHEVSKPPELAKRGGAWFKAGPTVLHLGIDRDFKAAKKAHPAFRCGEYEAFVESLISKGVSVTPDDLPFEGMQHCYIADPFGNRLEIIADKPEGS